MPRSDSAGMIGIVPPDRVKSGGCPKTSAKAARASPIAGASGSTSEAGLAFTHVIETSAPAGAAQHALERADHLVRVLAWRQPHRDVGVRVNGKDRLDEIGLAGTDAVDVDRGVGDDRLVEPVRVDVGPGSAAVLVEHRRPGVEFGPARELAFTRRDHTGPQLVRHRDDGPQHVGQNVRGVQRPAAEQPRVQIAITCHDGHLEVRKATSPDLERRRIEPGHHAVEDHARIGPDVLALEQLGHRAAADLLLAVTEHTQVDRKPSTGRQIGHCTQEQVQVPLVVDCAAPIQVSVADLGHERVGLPERALACRLHVDVPVDEHVWSRLGIDAGCKPGVKKR